jgi:hypothetical protein
MEDMGNRVPGHVHTIGGVGEKGKRLVLYDYGWVWMCDGLVFFFCSSD